MVVAMGGVSSRPSISCVLNSREGRNGWLRLDMTMLDEGILGGNCRDLEHVL